MDGNNSNQLTGNQFKILLTISIATLLAVVVLYVSQPPIDPGHIRLNEMVEAQDWLIGKLSKEVRELNVENVKLSFGMDVAQSRAELVDQLEAYEVLRDEWKRDLDASRERIEARYHEEYPEQAESDTSESTEDADYDW